MAIILNNTTKYDAQFTVLKGDQVVVSLPAVEPQGSVSIPTENEYMVTAQATIDGNTYTSAPLKVDGAARFQARVIQHRSQQTYIFDLVKSASTKPNKLQFEKTCLPTVIFTIVKDGKPLQAISVSDSFLAQELTLSDTYTISAVVKGITTDVTTTNNPNAKVTAIDATASADEGYFSLLLGQS
ncbi:MULTISPECIES: hypothetical protein [unclassified Duganella]|uniref:hypothetical protein n=1 Tax=unclassified Duganella TaxID=2636909 RepID=UPI0008830AF9|nr:MULTISPECIES: hypothetical protein [unclassified Duganella]SDF58456.1 hypothetical protein SAMN05216320_101645 [Duganella sp. OV458]SDI70128.1 hypothetical protein SAMN05428973_101770 [Duganella sp. OV510]